MATKIVRTCQIRIGSAVHAVGTVAVLADYAYREMHRKYPNASDEDLETLWVSLRKTKKAEFAGVTLVIEPITEEYEEDEDEG